MANIFFDTNTFINVVYRKPQQKILDYLKDHVGYISPLSVSNYCYIGRIKLPNDTLKEQIGIFSSVALTEKIIQQALEGPTDDIEDNVQLHSAAEAACDYFFTEDKKLLTMRFFGKMKIVSQLT